MKNIDVVAGILEQGDTILLAQRAGDCDQAGLWEFPGGKVEPGETQPQALMRELHEELGITASVGAYVASHAWAQATRVIHLYAWRIDQFEGEIQRRCHSAFAWVTPEQAREYPLAPADVPLLEAYIAASRA